MEKLLEKLYTDPKNPVSFGGAEGLYKAAHAINPHISRARVKAWLASKDSYTLHKQAKRGFKRSRLISQGLYIQADIDLMDVSNVAVSNDKVKFLLAAVDTFSRKAYVQPLQSKAGAEVVRGLEKLWGADTKPRLVRSDKGKEFTNRTVQDFFKKQGTHHFVTSNEVKANYVERFFRTLRGKIHRMITERQNDRYIDHLQDIVQGYNNKVHSSIGISPAGVNESNERLIWYTQYWPKDRKKKAKPFLFQVNDLVRITYLRTAFTRGYDYHFSGEVFKVLSRSRRDDIPVYKLVDMADEPVLGTFYTEELTKVAPKDLWLVEKVIRKRHRRGHQPESLVKFLHFPEKFNQWVDSNTIVDI